MPKISVLLPVKNGAKYIAESIESTLDQSFTDFEILVFDDNSTDNTIGIINRYKDPRIKLYQSKACFISNLNTGLEISSGKYIARMDADDLMSPIRLETQFRIMENSDVDVCGSWILMFGEGMKSYVHAIFEGYIENPIRRLRHTCIVAHPSVMLRKEFFINNNLRYQNYPHVEDYKLWFEAAKKNAVFYVEPQVLLAYRNSAEQITKIREKEIGEQSIVIRNEVNKYLNLES